MIKTIEHRTNSDDLLDLVPVDTPGAGDPSQAQADLMVRLIEEIRALDPETAKLADGYMSKMSGRWERGRGGNASRWIDRLMTKRDELRANAPQIEIEDGMYLLDGAVYKVQRAVHGSGRQYAKKLVPGDEFGAASFAYAPGVVRKLRPEHRMSLEQAKEFGALYGTCAVCGRTLTNETSIEAGIGPICAEKF